VLFLSPQKADPGKLLLGSITQPRLLSLWPEEKNTHDKQSDSWMTRLLPERSFVCGSCPDRGIFEVGPRIYRRKGDGRCGKGRVTFESWEDGKCICREGDDQYQQIIISIAEYRGWDSFSCDTVAVCCSSNRQGRGFLPPSAHHQ
jgi:hypothetical protein